MWTLSGTGFVSASGTKQSLKKDDLFIMPENMPHEYGNGQKDAEWTTCWITLTGKRINPFLADLGLDRFRVIKHAVPPRNHFKSLLRTAGRPALLGDLERAQTAFRILYELAALCQSKVSVNPENRFVKIAGWAKNNLGRGVNVDAMAQKAGLSRSHFSRQFTAAMGTGPAEFLLEARLDKARQLLSSTGMGLKAAGHACGFFDTAHFCRLFKSRTGMTPTLFRKQVVI
jgi:AraC-like DNA-binding protein